MNKTQRRLYESIMQNVAREVSKAMNEKYIACESFDELTNKYMPAEGNAKTLAGELVRAVNRIEYRFYNDGDKAGEGYGRETVNPAVRFLYRNINRKRANQVLIDIVNYLMDAVEDAYVSNELEYENKLEELKTQISQYICDNALWDTPNSEDMLNYATEEDVDDSEWEDDYDDWMND